MVNSSSSSNANGSIDGSRGSGLLRLLSSRKPPAGSRASSQPASPVGSFSSLPGSPVSSGTISSTASTEQSDSATKKQSRVGKASSLKAPFRSLRSLSSDQTAKESPKAAATTAKSASETPSADAPAGDSGTKAEGEAVTWETIEPPEEFVCPLSLEVMYDPVIVSSGQTYERAFIQRWISDGHTTCPKTRQPLDSKAIFPNQVLKVMIVDWCKQNGVPLPAPRKPEESDIVFEKAMSGDFSTLPQPMLRRSRQAAETAARAAAVALESERRQRVLLERMVEQRGTVRAIERSRRRSARHMRVAAMLGAASGDSLGSVGSIGYTPAASGSVIGSMDSITSDCPDAAGPLGSREEGGAGPSRTAPDDSDRYANGIPPSLQAFARLAEESAGWPGQLAMKATIFQSGQWSITSMEPSGMEESGCDGDTVGGGEGAVAASGGGGAEVNRADLQAEAGVAGSPRRGAETPRSMISYARSVSQRSRADSGRYSGSFSFDEDAQSVGTSVAELQMLDVEQLVQNVKSGAAEDQAAGAALLRVMTRHGFKHSKKVVEAGAVEPLIDLMLAEDEPTVEHAVTTLLNLCLDSRLMQGIAEHPRAVTNLVTVLSTGMPQARGNAAAALYCLSTTEGFREAIVEANAVGPLVTLLEEGVGQAKKDGANCLVSLSLAKAARTPIARSGVVRLLCRLLRDGDDSVEEQTSAVFATLVRDPEGRTVLFDEGAIPALAELVEGGASNRCREYAVNALLGLAVNSRVCLAAIDEEGISASIDVLTRTGSTKTQAKATALLELLRKFDAAEPE